MYVSFLGGMRAICENLCYWVSDTLAGRSVCICISIFESLSMCVCVCVYGGNGARTCEMAIQ